jgi:hypothetical protein
MSTTSATMTAKLRAGFLGVALGLLPSAVLAADASNANGTETTFEGVPDHAQAEAQGVGQIAQTSADVIPDHAQAEARNVGDDATQSTSSSNTMGPIVPDHATAESRGAGSGE